VWRLGGNICGNATFDCGDDTAGRTSAIQHWWEVERPAWIARHYRDHRIAGVIAQVKWGAVGTLGVRGMKKVIEEEIRKNIGHEHLAGQLRIDGIPRARTPHRHLRRYLGPKKEFAEDVHRYGGRVKTQKWTALNPWMTKFYTAPPIRKTPKPCECGSPHAVWQEHREDEIPFYQCDQCASRRTGIPVSELHPMKPNHTADEVVTIEGPQDHSLDIERVRTVIDDEMHRVGVVYVTFHFIHNRKHRTHSDDFAPSDKWFPVIEELFDEVESVYKVTIQPSDKLGKAKRLQGNPSRQRLFRVQVGHGVGDSIRFFDDRRRCLDYARKSGGIPQMHDPFNPNCEQDETGCWVPIDAAIDNPREHRSTSRQGHYVANLLRNPVLESGASFDEDDAKQVAKESRSLSNL
jgi:hypothetical protein